MMMKRVKIASNFVYQRYLGKLGEKFKTLIKPARRGYWGWRSGKTFSAQGPAQPPGEFTNLFHQSRFRQTSVSACVPASGQGGQPCWTPQEPPSPGNSPWYRRSWFQERETTPGNIFRDRRSQPSPSLPSTATPELIPKGKTQGKGISSMEMPVLIKAFTAL